MHISESSGAETVGRCGNTRSPISVDQIREWCGNPDATVTVKPVIDLDDHIHVEAYETPTDSRTRTPWSTSTASSRTAPKQHALRHRPRRPLRRRRTDELGQHRALVPTHHRAKTHSAWDYTVLDRGTYLWTTPTASR